jgi:hypothetical protein
MTEASPTASLAVIVAETLTPYPQASKLELRGRSGQHVCLRDGGAAMFNGGGTENGSA